MLKIKEDILLKELEKYGFEPRYNEYTGEIARYVYGMPGLEGIRIGVEARLIDMLNGSFRAMDILYDLIQAGFVVKVVKEE
jgi:hypothetical protein